MKDFSLKDFWRGGKQYTSNISSFCPLVSVIMPMYNSAQFIPQTLESLLYQTMKDFEVIVVDDCSTDNSVEVVESFKPKFAVGGACFVS